MITDNISEILSLLRQDYERLIENNMLHKANGVFRAMYLINEYKNNLEKINE